MNIDEIKEYLSNEHLQLDDSIDEQLVKIKEDAVSKNNEKLANEVWCIQQIYKIQSLYLDTFNELKHQEYEAAWNNLERIEIEMIFLKDNYDYSEEKYNLGFIEKVVGCYSKLFPYEYFASREGIIKSEECSICGKKISIRKRCKHKVGKLYMGELCSRKVTDYELLGIAIVKNPFDKYTVLKPEGLEYNYDMLEFLMQYLDSPYDNWYVDEMKIKKQEYININRNDKCPCGSGKKYKKCCLGKERELRPHYRITLLNGKKLQETPIKYVGTWRNKTVS